ELHGHVQQPEADRAAPDRSRHQHITYTGLFQPSALVRGAPPAPGAFLRPGRGGKIRAVLFELRDVSLARCGRQALGSFAARVSPGSTAVVGPSGSGKSTLLRLLTRLADPDRGSISYRGEPLDACDPLRLRREVSLVPQLPALLDGTVEANIRYAAR